MNGKIAQEQIVKEAIAACLPDAAVQRALRDLPQTTGKKILVAVGKAAWRMAKAALEAENVSFDDGIVITKYGHVEGPLEGVRCYEAGHPILDENSLQATEAALETVRGLASEDLVVVLLSGGGSALFEKPLIPLEELTTLTDALLAKGANIVEMNRVRKRFSGVKGGRFALACAPAQVYNIILSDIIGDPIDMIASGPTYPDDSTCAQAQAVIAKYDIPLSAAAQKLLVVETPAELTNVQTTVSGSVTELCCAARSACERLGYATEILTTSMDCEAREAGRLLGSIGHTHAGDTTPRAYLFGGETVVHLRGKGKGGRNQELALAAAPLIAGCDTVRIFSFGSDGTDGPTDAAGGCCDGNTMAALKKAGVSLDAALADNDAYHALGAVNQLIFTGPTGTNVNDLSVVLITPEDKIGRKE
uniref:glycerate kinase type-2 family protein n=1 Tax=Ndongobacter massiliensis TaxID=1871025 RepID=UPI000930B588|nr:DUF4147 domain-containing protein [Ndongobacter massiliensis]